MELLAHPIALDAFNSLSKGASPKGVLAGIAADLAAAHVRDLLGGSESVPPKAQRVDDGIVDAEFKVINVTPKKESK
jgi:hypothetical protein